MEQKQCTTCEEFKGFEAFPKGKQRKDGSYALRPVCKVCTVKHNLQVYHDKGGKQKQKQRSFKNNLKKYGITPEDYQRLFDEQKGKCKICGSTESFRNGSSYNLFVDHDHSTNKVRGLLCHNCNAGLGHFRDNEGYLNKAIEYLNENRT